MEGVQCGPSPLPHYLQIVLPYFNEWHKCERKTPAVLEPNTGM
jgi:hypothetical protein